MELKKEKKEEKATEKSAVEEVDAIVADMKSEVVAELKADMKAEAKKAEKSVKAKSKIMEVAEKSEEDSNIIQLAKAFTFAAQGDVEKVKTVLTTGTDSLGGYTLPKPLFNTLIEEADVAPMFSQRVTVLPMSTKTLDITELVKDDANPNVTDTVEGASKDETAAAFAKTILTAFKQASVLPLTDELIDDSNFDLMSILIARFGAQIGRKIDNLILNGNDTTQPEGLFTNTVIEAAAIETAGALDFDDIITAMYSVVPEHRSDGVWMINTQEVAALRLLKDGDGRYMWSDPIAPGQPATLHGYPVLESRFVPAGELMFGDLKQYWLGMRQEATIRVSNEARFEEDQTVIRAVLRVAGKVGFTAAFKKIKVTAAA